MALQNALTATRRTFSTFMTADAVKNRINSMMSSKDGIRFIGNLIAAVSNNPALAECEHSTILSAALLGESLKLSPSIQLGQFYLVPYNDKKNDRKTAQFQIGYKGYIQLAMRSGQYRDLDVIEVREGEYKGKDPFTGKPRIEFIEDDAERLRLPIIGYFAYFELLNGFRKSLYWTKEKMEQHADTYSQAFSLYGAEVKTQYGIKHKASYADYTAGNYDKKDEWMYSSFWYKNFDEMAFKTMLRQLISKWGIMSIDFQTAVERDMAVIKDDMTPVYVDNTEVQPPDAVLKPEIEQREEAAPIAANQQTEQFDDPFSNFD